MGKRKRAELPSSLLRLEKQFAEWRKNRQRGERIPRRLWNSAASIAQKHGVNQTATVLKLEYYALKRRVDERSSEASPSTAFLELPPAAFASASECVVEFEDRFGSSMRVHLKGAEVPDLLALSRDFWNAD